MLRRLAEKNKHPRDGFDIRLGESVRATVALDRPKSSICVISLEGANPEGVKTEAGP